MRIATIGGQAFLGGRADQIRSDSRQDAISSKPTYSQTPRGHVHLQGRPTYMKNEMMKDIWCVWNIWSTILHGKSHTSQTNIMMHAIMRIFPGALRPQVHSILAISFLVPTFPCREVVNPVINTSSVNVLVHGFIVRAINDISPSSLYVFSQESPGAGAEVLRAYSIPWPNHRPVKAGSTQMVCNDQDPSGAKHLVSAYMVFLERSRRLGCPLTERRSPHFAVAAVLMVVSVYAASGQSDVCSVLVI